MLKVIIYAFCFIVTCIEIAEIFTPLTTLQVPMLILSNISNDADDFGKETICNDGDDFGKEAICNDGEDYEKENVCNDINDFGKEEKM